MTQEAIEISTTPPLPGLKLVQDVNKALQTIATDFAGPTDPSGLPGCGPYCTWADTANGLIKRRNAANMEWVVIGSLFLNAGTDHAGSEPANPVPFMTWADTANGLVKRRSADNVAWAVEGELFTYKANRNGDATQNFKAAPAADVGDVVTFEQVFGPGKEWTDKAGSRLPLVTYTNTTERIRYIHVRLVSTAQNLVIRVVTSQGDFLGNQILNTGFESVITVPIMPGSSYEVNQFGTGGLTVTRWMETA